MPPAYTPASVPLRLSLPGAERFARSVAQLHPRPHVPPRCFFTCRFRGREKGDRSIVLRRDGGINAGACSGSIRGAIRERPNALFRHDGISPRAGYPVRLLHRRSDAPIFILVCDSPTASFSAPPSCPSVAPRTIDRNRRDQARTSGSVDARRLHGCRGSTSLIVVPERDALACVQRNTLYGALSSVV